MAVIEAATSSIVLSKPVPSTEKEQLLPYTTNIWILPHVEKGIVFHFLAISKSRKRVSPGSGWKDEKEFTTVIEMWVVDYKSDIEDGSKCVENKGKSTLAVNLGVPPLTYMHNRRSRDS